MIANTPKHVDKNFPDAFGQQLFGKLELPAMLPWSYPPHAHHAARTDRQKKGEPGQSSHAGPYQDIAARLKEMPPEVLLPVRTGHDYVGGWIASLIVLTVGITLLLLVI